MLSVCVVLLCMVFFVSQCRLISAASKKTPLHHSVHLKSIRALPHKFDESKKVLRNCVLVNGSWYTPAEFESLGGKKAKCGDNLFFILGSLYMSNSKCVPIVGSVDAPLYILKVFLCLVRTGVLLFLFVTHHTPVLPVRLPSDSPFLVSALLAFIKAYRLRGDVESLKKSVINRFSSDDVEAAKKLLWDHCERDLLSADLLFHSRHDSVISGVVWLLIIGSDVWDM